MPNYNPEYFAPLFAVEDRHFWFSARRQIMGRLLTQFAQQGQPMRRMLEVGCGDGNMLRLLEQVGEHSFVVGLDAFAEGLAYARQRTTCALVQGDLHHPPFQTEFDMIGAFDVLEHLADDVQMLIDLHALLAPGGMLLITVPAYASLWSEVDELARHCRRYAPEDLREKLTLSGYQVEYVTPYMCSLYPLVWLSRKVAHWLRRRISRRTPSAQEEFAQELRILPGINTLLIWILMQEVWLLMRRATLPCGTSLLAIARKKDE